MNSSFEANSFAQNVLPVKVGGGGKSEPALLKGGFGGKQTVCFVVLCGLREAKTYSLTSKLKTNPFYCRKSKWSEELDSNPRGRSRLESEL
jgi:hypothetical protein